jgi:hypothetical protein
MEDFKSSDFNTDLCKKGFLLAFDDFDIGWKLQFKDIFWKRRVDFYPAELKFCFVSLPVHKNDFMDQSFFSVDFQKKKGSVIL